MNRDGGDAQVGEKVGGVLPDLALARAHFFSFFLVLSWSSRSFSSGRPAPGASQHMWDEARAACFAEAE